jgi:hypothetical protein
VNLKSVQDIEKRRVAGGRESERCEPGCSEAE